MCGHLILMTEGFRNLPEELQNRILKATLDKISSSTDLIVFDPYVDPDAPLKETYEDEGRTLRIPVRGLERKVYGKLDDFGSAEALSREAGFPVQTRYALTLMLADEY